MLATTIETVNKNSMPLLCCCVGFLNSDICFLFKQHMCEVDNATRLTCCHFSKNHKASALPQHHVIVAQ